ncbi:MAG TPA: trypsin-like peptidase domain-containing protein, partial [Steroidobacteraceae bacterium]|nr:trypsin-like peptidase domain-containing protein [Steroidobacteraceae bacterium]
MSDPQIRLRELAADCRVRVGLDIADAPEEGGSGVWIAPGKVLTCAHVVPAGRNTKVEVGWHDHTLSGIVTDQVPNTARDGLWPYPDLAVIAVDGAPEHPCAWLSEAVPMHDLVAFGHSAALGEGLRQADVGGWRGGSHVFGEGRFWQFKGNELVSGMSGGPVLDVSSGAVCGIVTVSIGEGADRGGYVMPVEGLRHLGLQRRHDLLTAHDQFHGRDRRWTALRAGLPAPPSFARCPITPAEEVELLQLLAQFPAADLAELLTLVACNSVNRRLPVSPGSLRDVAYALLDGGGLDSELVVSLLRMTHHLVGSSPKPGYLALYDWATALAARHQRLTELQ